MPAEGNPSETRLREVFAAALEKPNAEERGHYLDEACSGDPGLRSRVEALLGAHERADKFLDHNAHGEDIDLDDEGVGTMIGPYRLLKRLGAGGFGVVYRAEQTKPIRREVALKIIKLGMDTRAVIARFEAERQALALMDHPNIAKVLDAGATDTGRPYFVMELVQGVRITDYCDQSCLSTPARLELFTQVCQAIQHAHQKGIIHRDLKPSNILVTLQDGVPVPKVIDFGIAKATGGQVLTDKTLYTALDQFLGTPAYTSPEQAQAGGVDIDTRSDIYNLGVLLYELLTGHTPFEHKRLVAAGLDEIRRIIREEEPARPSTRLSALSVEEQTTVSKRRDADPPELIHLVRGDLDWIVMKCLEKDRNRRYETANALAQDIHCHLNNEAVAARPPSRIYRLRKLIRRNKLAVASGAAIGTVLVLGTLVSAWQAVRATRATGEALSAHESEARLRRQAEAAELAARQRAYASDMIVAKAALDGNSFGRALELLNRQRPPPGQKDLRGWEWRYLWQQSRSDALFTLSEEPSTILSLAVSPDGTLLAIGVKHKGGLAVWDMRTRQEAFRLLENEVAVRATFSPTEPLLAVSSTTAYMTPQARTFLRLWNTATRQKVAEFQIGGRTSHCRRIAFSEDGRRLAIACASSIEGEGEIALWRVADRTKFASYPLETAPAMQTDVALSRDLSLAAYVLWDGRLRVIDLRGLRELWTAATTNENTAELAFSPDGRMLATGAQNSDSRFYGNVHLWDTATGKTLARMPGHSGLPGHSFYMNALVFWPNGRKLATGSGDETIRIWDLASQTCLGVLHGLHQEVWELAVLPDQKTLVGAGVRGRVCVWDTSLIHPRQPRITLPESLVCWVFAPDGNSVLAVSREGQVSRWSGPDFQHKELLLQQEANPVPLDKWEIPHAPLSYLFSQDRRFLATGSRTGALAVWDLARAVLVRQWTNTTAEVRPLSFLAGADRLITDSVSDNSFHEWDLLTGSEIQRWQKTAARCMAALSPDERAVLAVDSEGSIVLRNLRERSDAKMALDFQEPSSYGHATSYSPEGKLFAAASQLGYARVWETATWQPQATLGGFLSPLGSVAFSPDGARLVTAGSCNTPSPTLKLWDADSWQELLTLRGGDDQCLFANAEFSPDGSALGAMDTLGTLYLWLAPSWQEIADAEKTAATAGRGEEANSKFKGAQFAPEKRILK